MNIESWNLESSHDPSDLVAIRELVVDFGRRRALDEVTLRVPAGEVFGLLGPNGAGKTTMFRVMATLLRPTRGEVRLCGGLVGSDSAMVRSRITYMPDLAPMPSDLRALEYLRYFAAAYGLRGKLNHLRVDECLEAVGLTDRGRDICTKLSLGMRQRLALAKAMLHRPRLLILDEPASGLDPLARVDLRKALRRQAENGTTVILSSHVIAEIQDLCTSIGILHHGKLLDAGPIRNVLGRFSSADTRVILQAPGAGHEVASWVAERPGVLAARGLADGESVEVLLNEAVFSRADLFSALGAARCGVVGMRTVETSVEDVIVSLGTKKHQP